MGEELGKPVDLKTRTKQYALRIIRLYSALPRVRIARVVGDQVLRSGTSVGAHYREGIRSRSDAELVSKLEGALQELEETRYWLELLVEGEIVPERRLESLLQETDELLAIITTCVKRTKARKR